MRPKSTIPAIRPPQPEMENHIVMWMEKFGRQLQATRDMPDCELLFIGVRWVVLQVFRLAARDTAFRLRRIRLECGGLSCRFSDSLRVTPLLDDLAGVF
jgi:hypothetical protein